MPSRKKELNEQEQKQKKIAYIFALSFALLILIDFIVISIIYSWADWVALLIFALLFIVPAYIANAGMVLVGGGKPIDWGKMFFDGRPILGPGKTWNGLIKGPLYIGIPISVAIFLAAAVTLSLMTPFSPTIRIFNGSRYVSPPGLGFMSSFSRTSLGDIHPPFTAILYDSLRDLISPLKMFSMMNFT